MSINTTANVLVLRCGKKDKQYLGRSPHNQSIYFKSEIKNLIGSTVDVTIKQAFQNSLSGNIR